MPPAAAPRRQKAIDAPCKRSPCQSVYPDAEALKRQSAPTSDIPPHIAAVAIPQARCDSPHFLAEINPPMKFEGRRASNASGNIRESGSVLAKAIPQSTRDRSIPTAAFAKSPKSADDSILLKSGGSSVLRLCDMVGLRLLGEGSPPLVL